MNLFSRLFFRTNQSPAIESIDSDATMVGKLAIKSKKLSNHLFAGEYHAAFKGMGMVFKEVKQYAEGDDIRFIDWNVSARMGSFYSKVFEEERALSIYIIIDISASHLFGGNKQSKKALITEIAGLLAFSAASNNDNVSILFCSDKVEKYIPPKKGKDHVLYMIRSLATYQPKAIKTDLGKAFHFLNGISKHKSIVFVLSDFINTNYEQSLRIASKKHDVIGIKIFDKLETALPTIGVVKLADIETGKEIWLNTNDAEVRNEWQNQYETIASNTRQYFKKAGAALVEIETGADYVAILQNFMRRRVK